MNAQKRILPLLALAAVVLLAMTGCDKILETMFPVETGVRTSGGGAAGQNTVSVNVTLPTAGVDNFAAHDIYVKIERSDGSAAPQIRHRPASLPPGQTGGNAAMSTQFDFLADGGYHLMAWLEMSGNNAPDPTEPQGAPSGGREYFTLPDGNNRSVSFDIGLVVPNTSGQNRVTAMVRVPKTVTGWDVPNSLMMTLENLDGVQIYMPTRRGTAGADPDPTLGSFQFVYDSLVGGSYHAYAWLDLNGNLLRDTNEPQGVPGQEFFGLPVGGLDQRTFDIMLQVPDMSGQNTVTATVKIPITIPGWNTPNWLMIQLEKQNGAQIYQPMRRGTAVMDPTDPTRGVATFTYNNVPGGSYHAYAWLDINGDGLPTLNQAGVNEPYGVPNTNEYFSLPSTGAMAISLSVDVALAATGSTTITWNVHVANTITGWDGPGNVKATLVRTTDASPVPNANQTRTAAYDATNPTNGLATFVWGSLAEGYYHLVTWLDTNGNWLWDPTEYGTVTTPDQYVSAGTSPTYDAPAITATLSPIDSYESDDTWDRANPIWVNDTAQQHYLDSAVPGGDQDWVTFYAIGGVTYTIQTHLVTGYSAVDTVLELYGTDGISFITSDDDGAGFPWSKISGWQAPADGWYFAKVRGYSASYSGPYTIDVVTP